jgi:hypothetical protein
MWTNKYNPTNSDWYIVVVDGKKSPMSWNSHNKFWVDFGGKTYKPEQIDRWLDDSIDGKNNFNYVIRKHKLNGIWNFDIENQNLIYCDMSPTHHGLQCNHEGDKPEYNEIMILCDQIVNIIKRIDELNTI